MGIRGGHGDWYSDPLTCDKNHSNFLPPIPPSNLCMFHDTRWVPASKGNANCALELTCRSEEATGSAAASTVLSHPNSAHPLKMVLNFVPYGIMKLQILKFPLTLWTFLHVHSSCPCLGHRFMLIISVFTKILKWWLILLGIIFKHTHRLCYITMLFTSNSRFVMDCLQTCDINETSGVIDVLNEKLNQVGCIFSPIPRLTKSKFPSKFP